MSRLASLLACLAALMGASGVALAALAAHADGGDFGKLAAQFLILHAAALIGISAHGARALDDARAVLWLGFALALGAILFSADLASLAFLHGHARNRTCQLSRQIHLGRLECSGVKKGALKKEHLDGHRGGDQDHNKNDERAFVFHNHSSFNHLHLHFH